MRYKVEHLTEEFRSGSCHDFMASQNRSGRLIQPEEVAEEALKVASEDSKLTGKAIDI